MRRRAQPADRLGRHARQVDELDERRVDVGERVVDGRAAIGRVAGECGEAGAQRRAHSLGPAGRLDGDRIGGQDGAHGIGRGSDHDHQRRTAPRSQHVERAAHQRDAVELHQRLGATHPAAGTGGEQQARGHRQRLITVTGCS